MAAAFDDLAFPNFGARAATHRRRCPACEDARMMPTDEWTCPTCGERMLPDTGAPTASEEEGSPPVHPMMAQLMHQSMAAAAAASASGAGAASEDGSGLSADLQSLFIPSLNSTYLDMVRAQQGVSIETLMNQMLQNESLQAPPTSRRFLEQLKERPLVRTDFIQLYLRFDSGAAAAAEERPMTRDIFPTVATFGTGHKFVQEHAEKLAEEKAAAAAEAEAEATREADASGTPSGAASAPAGVVSTDGAGDPRPSPPLVHATYPLVASTPLSGKAPTNARLFRGACVLFERGAVSFVAKARATQDAMGRALLVVQTEPDEKAWPFTMSDTTGAGADIVVPALMVSKSDGEAIQAALERRRQSSSSSSSTTAPPMSVKILTRERPLACCICREDFVLGQPAVELPCSHLFCDGCIRPWLSTRSLCPLCRFALPTEAAKAREDLRGPESNHAQLQRDMFT